MCYRSYNSATPYTHRHTLKLLVDWERTPHAALEFTSDHRASLLHMQLGCWKLGPDSSYGAVPSCGVIVFYLSAQIGLEALAEIFGNSIHRSCFIFSPILESNLCPGRSAGVQTPTVSIIFMKWVFVSPAGIATSLLALLKCHKPFISKSPSVL